MEGAVHPAERAAVGHRIVAWGERVAGSPLFAYGSVLAIQAKVLWGIWQYRDLTSGDTATYFSRAADWSTSLHLNPVWSPLDSIAWGSLQWAIHDPYAVTITYRVLIALAASALVLAVLRRLLTPGIAWALAVWWAILPVNFDDTYEVHLLALIGELLAVVLALSLSGRRMRSVVFCVLLAESLLVRNETLIAAAVWLLVWLAYEWRRQRRTERVSPWTVARPILAALGVIVAIEALVILRDPQRDQLRAAADAKQESNVCQIYAYGYQQRHSDFVGSPWVACDRLMERDFGRPRPTLTQALFANPGAMASHFLWNVQLTPAALQLLLFDRTSAGPSHNPDYIPVRTGSTAALLGSILMIGFCTGGALLLWRSRRWWSNAWITRRAGGWLALLAIGLSDVFVMIVMRPRPEFVLSLTVLLLAAIGMAAMAYVHVRPWLGRLGAAVPVLTLALLVGLPSHYGPGYRTPLIGRPGRPLMETVDRLQPYAQELRGERVALLASYGADACYYVGREDPCGSVSWAQIRDRPAGQSVEQALDRHGVTFIYADRADLQDPAIRGIVAGLSLREWRRLGPGLAQGWELLRRTSHIEPEAKTTSSPT